MDHPRVQQLVPFVYVADVQRSVDFYEELGLEVIDTYEQEGWLLWAFMAADRARVMLTQASDPIHAHDQTVLFYVFADDLDALHAALGAAGVEVGDIEDGTPGPPREFRTQDPDGYVLMVAEDRGQ